MIKKQTGFQMASYLFPEDYWPQGGGSAKYGRMRSEVETLQEDGWEVIDVQLGSTVQGEGTSTQLNVVLTLVKYEWVDEPGSNVEVKFDADLGTSLDDVAKEVEAKAKAGRPKKDA